VKHFIGTAILFLACALALPASQIVTLSGPLSGQAEFAFSNGSFTVTLTNATTIHSAADLLTDLIFNLSACGLESRAGDTIVLA
jgi:hypothetical protein